MGLFCGETVQSFFYTQSISSQSIITPGEHTILTLDVTTTELGERVKLDSMAVIQYLTNNAGTSFRVTGDYLLYRDDTLISIVDIEKGESKTENIFHIGNINTNLTWVDEPPTVGTHRYEIRIDTSNLINNLASLNVLTAHSLNAIVFGLSL
ncbi:hypothetical protein ACN6MT_18870 [Neobacillus niacini]|uniref:hypothetical protein n=1 Tax=Neobacillus niacini TaxID=86668 RepID=UPI003B024A74